MVDRILYGVERGLSSDFILYQSEMLLQPSTSACSVEATFMAEAESERGHFYFVG